MLNRPAISRTSYNRLIPAQCVTWHLADTPVLVRVDFNSKHTDEPFKLTQTLPTLELLQKKRAKIILITHISPTSAQPNILPSTRHIANWLTEHGYPTQFAKTIHEAYAYQNTMQSGSCIMLENLRMWPEEKENNRAFALQLQKLASYYIQDAWGTVHRNHASMAALAQLYDPTHKSIGLLVAHELERLSWLHKNAPHPRAMLLGGGKATTKLAYIPKLLTWADTLLLAPTLSYPFSKHIYLNKPASSTTVLSLEIAQKLEKRMIVPADYQVSKSPDFTGPYYEQLAHDIRDYSSITTIGALTIRHYKDIISNAQTIFINGVAGFSTYPATEMAYKTLLQTVAQSDAFTAVSGGDSVAAVYKYGIEHAIQFCSTGGGATLAYLASAPLPGLDNLI